MLLSARLRVSGEFKALRARDSPAAPRIPKDRYRTPARAGCLHTGLKPQQDPGEHTPGWIQLQGSENQNSPSAD